MVVFRADLHIHSTLSPCGDLEMSPRNIVDKALQKQLDIIAITDHNSTKQCEIIRELGAENGLVVIGGAEVTSKEEVHCLTYFGNLQSLQLFQVFIDQHLPNLKNNERLFGYQVVVDRNDEILENEERLLISALDCGVKTIRQKVEELGGLFIPAHVDKSRNSLFSQLGVYDTSLQVDGFEISPFATKDAVYLKYKLPSNLPCIGGSDAHYINDIGRRVTLFTLENPSFQDIANAFRNREDIEHKNIVIN